MADTQTGTRPSEQNGGYSTEATSEQPRDQALRDQTPPEGSSDSDNAERSARNKLKKASIAALSEQSQPQVPSHSQHPLSESTTVDSFNPDAPPVPRGRLPRKRSFENSQTDDSPTLENGSADHLQLKSGHHKRMRSRDISSGEYIGAGSKFDNGTAEPLEEESDDEAQQSPGGPGILVDVPPRDAKSPPRTGPTDKSDPADITSPKKKRSRDQLDPDDGSKDADSDESEASQTSPQEHLTATGGQLAPTISRSAIGEPEKKRHRDEALLASADHSNPENTALSKSETGLPPTSGFANSSTASPFGNFRSPSKPSEAVQRTEPKSTSTSAFASSGLSAFASSEKSPFGAFGSSQASASGGFGSGPAPSAFGSASSTTTSGFGNTGATSPFAANRTTGFGSLGGFGASSGSGFGGGGFGGGLKPLAGGFSSFASASGTSGFGGSSAKQKAFGAPEEEDEDGSDGGDSDEDDAEDRPKDKRFVEQDLETGEEEEQTVFSCRAKLYHFEGKEWKERGVGTIKLNIRWALSDPLTAASPDPEEDNLDVEDQAELSSKGLEKKARLIMRTDGVHRVVLNTPVFKGMKAGTVDGEEPTGKTMQLTGMEGGKGVLYTLKVGKDDMLKELWRRIMDIQESL